MTFPISISKFVWSSGDFVWFPLEKSETPNFADFELSVSFIAEVPQCVTIRSLQWQSASSDEAILRVDDHLTDEQTFTSPHKPN